MAVVHMFGLLCILGATALLVIVSVGVPIWDRVDFLHAYSGQYLLGIWGETINGVSSKTKLGYNVYSSLNQNNNFSNETRRVVSRGLTYALVLNPIAAGFAGLALLAALFANTACGIFASVLAFWAFLVSIVALAVDLACFIMIRNRLNRDDPSANAHLGKAMWMIVAAAAALLLASVTVCFTHSSSKRRRDRDIETKPLATEPVMTEKRRRFPWQRKQQAAVY
ncbi:BZ3500_MvSof-1268-A1-R1_Chr3-3g06412 [Microbotryum saponariae]|uniref:BZ3500_MvSof-1268-A1-R1_Chr3-3g06412 protein n=1 Tax=Microbotryum saponariae TaxID=289078 RepID=A0A2X0LEZ7_9BASI|nr:BZ3500_MvSof-1268-A1-R1_Chr3-3g06412 [Microbotryum saponariae]SDA04379.1 BZ3501_MvSof-1269-A2-R1_Chr3-2g06099 [Microbotryum saponariae]